MEPKSEPDPKDNPPTPPAQVGPETAHARAAKDILITLDVSTTVPAGPWEPPTPPVLAAAFGGQFEIVEMIARGGMGAVYKVKHLALAKLMALKILPPSYAAEEEFQQRFHGEAKVLVHLEHPHIVRIYDCNKAGGWHYFTMEFVDGPTLKQLLKSGPLLQEDALTMFLQICSAVRFAHENGIIHRDLKPDNIIIDAKSGSHRVPKVLDFGIARAGVHTSLVTSGSLRMGTPFYMAPEQMTGISDERSDVFALGVVLHEMLSGRKPSSAPRQPLNHPKLDAVVSRCCQEEPAQRYAKVADLESEILLLVQTPALKRERRRSRLFLALLVSAVVGMSAAATAWIYAKHKQREASKSRESAENLVSSMLGDLRDDMEAMGRLDLLEKLIRAAQGYFENLSEDLRDAPSDWQRAWMWKYLGDVLQKEDREEEARPCYLKHMELLRSLAKGNPKELMYQRQFAQSLGDMGRVWEDQGDHNKAMGFFKEQLAILQERAASSTHSSEDLTALAAAWENLGHLQLKKGRTDEAESSFRQEMRLFEDLTEKGEPSTEDIRNFAKSLSNVGDMLKDDGRLAKAIEYHSRQRDLLGDLSANHLKDMRLLEDFAIAWNKLGKDLLLQGDLKKAKVSFQQFHDKMKHLAVDVDSNRPDYRRSFATSHSNLGDVAVKEEDWDAAASHYQQDLQLTQKLVEEFPQKSLYREDLIASLSNLARLNRLRGAPNEAARFLQNAHEEMDRLENTNSSPASLQRLRDKIDEAAGK